MGWNVIKQIVRNGIRAAAPLARDDALGNLYYNTGSQRIDFELSSRHPDLPLVTEPVWRNAAPTLKRTHRATPEPTLEILRGILKAVRRVHGRVAHV